MLRPSSPDSRRICATMREASCAAPFRIIGRLNNVQVLFEPSLEVEPEERGGLVVARKCSVDSTLWKRSASHENAVGPN